MACKYLDNIYIGIFDKINDNNHNSHNNIGYNVNNVEFEQALMTSNREQSFTYTCLHKFIMYTIMHEISFSSCAYLYIQAKCMNYWPDDVHTTLNVGSRFTVTLTSVIPSAEYQISKLQVKSVSTE